MSNPIWTSLLILALIVVVLMATYREPIRKAGGRKAARAFVYGLVIVVGVMTLHQYAVRREASASAAQKDIRDVFSSIEVSRSLGGSTAAPLLLPYAASEAAPRPPSATSEETAHVGGDPGMPMRTPYPMTRPDNLSAAEGLEIRDVELPLTVGVPARRV